MLQRSCFTFHVPGQEELTPAHNKSLKKYTIPSGAKNTLLHELILLGVDEFSIYGDLGHLASTAQARSQNSEVMTPPAFELPSRSSPVEKDPRSRAGKSLVDDE